MLCLSVYIFKLFFMVLLFRFHGCHAQLANESASPTITATWTGTYTDSVVCATAPADSLMDPPTAIRLGDLFCEALSKPENFPPQGGNLSQYHYPTELTEIPGSPNYTAMELSGLILDVFFYRNTPFVSNGTLELHGTDEQCARDNCTDIVAKDVDACQRNPYYYGGDNAWLTECGTYWVGVRNCSSNWWDPDCCRWHELHPDIGITLEEALDPDACWKCTSPCQPSNTTTTSNVTVISETTTLPLPVS
ncbi:hypothetical protein LTR72_002377 [Exophiala xenobiotica]|uniref:Uncharacterized protein n=1 Tax=Vermiconidia calcicola TaxID=1690605 RepID=A0AAV9PXD7_9PEZI|nr:hypothetical protein LTR72_002377 [Exophiala xenobiotica]KAK5530954.1 hypothetical protein LTR25_008811 [Vermiconidia calcicola]KAK5544446.1 hypothetical protein LTR23_004534 [Chaetothyriales sp. CCFEE 6169]KAK5337412.1 hypothetical protein LTR98_006527 [Exophiala xenobiotica]KAK5417945.1 hypothetical protein LTR90_005119 [Exophiala xenobiotica]